MVFYVSEAWVVSGVGGCESLKCTRFLWYFRPRTSTMWLHGATEDATTFPITQLLCSCCGCTFTHTGWPITNCGSVSVLWSWYNLACLRLCMMPAGTEVCTSGLYRWLLQGTNDQVHHNMSLWAGELDDPGVGVFLHSRIAFHMSLPSLCALLTTFFMIFTADTAFPFDLWWCGLEAMWLISQDLVRSENLCEL